jgi:putative transposase
MLGFKSFTSAASTIGGIEIVNMIRKGQFRPKLLPFQQFCQLAV